MILYREFALVYWLFQLNTKITLEKNILISIPNNNLTVFINNWPFHHSFDQFTLIFRPSCKWAKALKISRSTMKVLMTLIPSWNSSDEKELFQKRVFMINYYCTRHSIWLTFWYLTIPSHPRTFNFRGL